MSARMSENVKGLPGCARTTGTKLGMGIPSRLISLRVTQSPTPTFANPWYSQGGGGGGGCQPQGPCCGITQTGPKAPQEIQSQPPHTVYSAYSKWGRKAEP